MKLRPTQRQDVNHLIDHPLCGYFADVGTGKTTVTLQTLDHHLKNGGGAALVVSTVRVVENVWGQEIEKWGYELDYGLVRGTAQQRLEVLNEEHDIYAINFELLSWLITEAGIPDTVDTLIIDESTKLKDSRTKRFKALRQVLPWFKRRHILTGTPMPRHLEDLFGQAYILDQGAKLGQYITHYRNTYFTPTGYGGHTWVPKEGAEQAVLDKLSPILLRREAPKGVIPDVLVNDIEIELPPQGQEIYDEMESKLVIELDDTEITAAHAGAAIMKLRQVCNGFVYDGRGGAKTIHDAKVEALTDLVEDLSGEPLLVAYAFQEDAEVLGKLGIPVLTGKGKRAAQEIIDSWNAGELPVLALHPASAGHGLNLQDGGHHIAFFGLDYNREYYDQAIGRLARSGQKSSVFVHRLVVPDSVETVISRNLAEKGASQKSILLELKKKRQG